MKFNRKTLNVHYLHFYLNRQASQIMQKLIIKNMQIEGRGMRQVMHQQQKEIIEQLKPIAIFALCKISIYMNQRPLLCEISKFYTFPF